MIYIKEALPNPVGRDVDGEWIKLINTGEEHKDITGWKISDDSGKEFELKNLLDPVVPQGNEIILPYSLTRIVLNNSGDTVYLTNQEGDVADTLSYNMPVAEGEIVFASRFLPSSTTVTAEASVSELAIFNKGVIFNSPIFSSFVIAFFLAALAGFFAGAFIKLLIRRGE